MPAMLKYRLMLGPVMIAALLGVLWLDQWAEGAGHAKAGLAILVLLLLPGIVLAGAEIARLFQAKGVPTHGRVLAAAGIMGCAAVYLTTLAAELDWSQQIPPGVVIATTAPPKRSSRKPPSCAVCASRPRSSPRRAAAGSATPAAWAWAWATSSSEPVIRR